MVLRARIRPFARRAAFTAALGALLVPTVVGTANADAAKRKKKRYPVVTSVSPMSANVGDTLTIRGKNFKRGKNKNTVVFKRDGARAIFVKTTLATARQIRVTVPDTLRQFMDENVPTRYRLRVFSQRFGKKFTSDLRSPMITALPKPVAATPVGGAGGSASGGGTAPVTPPPPPPPPPPAPQVCTGDQDGDLLDAGRENNLGLDACKADTDGDGVPDGYEYSSARDLNDDEHQDPNEYLPYPGDRPYPNPLDKDADVDHDGDSLTLLEEYRLWKYALGRTPLVGDLDELLYSAGEQFSVNRLGSDGRRLPNLSATNYAKQNSFIGWAQLEGYDTVYLSDLGDEWYLPRTEYELRDFNRSGGPAGTTPYNDAYAPEVRYYDFNNDNWLTDAERDEDADGLTNFDETHGCATREYWDGVYDKETPYYAKFGAVDVVDSDSDGDEVRDGADDQDHDDIPNVVECSRNMITGEPEDPRPSDFDPPPHNALGFVNPFNPCLPHVRSRTCNRFPSLDTPWAPFNPKQDKYFYIWN